jgi:hypothetical protein
MAGDREIQDVIQVIAGTRGKDELYLFVGEVTNVDKSARTCTVMAHSGKLSAEVTDVKLMPTIDDGWLEIPETNSTVLVIGSKYAGFYVIQCSAIDEIIMRGGDLKGLVVLDKLVDRLNKIEDDINSLKTAFTGWTPAPNDGGAALKASASSWAGQRLVDTQASDIENTKITQG